MKAAFAPGRSDVRLGIVAFALLIIAICWTSVFVFAHNERQRQTEQVVTADANLARAFEEHAIRTIKQVDQLLLLVAAQFEQLGAKLDLGRFAREAGINPELVVIIAVVNERGDPILATTALQTTNLADREHFQAHVAENTGKPFIGKPVIGRVAKRWLIPISRRLNKPGGAFGGVVTIGVDPFYFSDFYRSIDLGKRGAVALIGRDGIVRSRLSGYDASVGQNVGNSPLLRAAEKNAHGSLAFASVIDGVPRLYSYRSLADYPLLLTVARAEVEALADSNRLQRDTYLTAGIMTTLVLAFCGVLLLLAHREQHALAALSAAQLRQAALLQSIPDPAWLKDAAGRYIAVNASHEALVGQSATAYLGKTGFEFMPRPLAETHHTEDSQVMRSGAPLRVARCGNLSGAEIWRDILKVPVKDEAGRVIGTAGVARDITEQKRTEQALRGSEERFRLIAETIAQVFWIFDCDHQRFVYVSPAYDELWPSDRETLRRDPQAWLAAVHPDDMAAARTALEAMTQAHKSDLEYRIRRTDGAVRHVQHRTFPVRNSKGETWACGMIGDVTDHRVAQLEVERLNATLARRATELEHTNRELEAFSYSVAHDLRNPLRSINGFSAVIAQRFGSQLGVEGLDFLERIRAAGQRMDELIDALLGLSRVARAELNCHSVNLSALVRLRAGELQRELPGRGADIAIADDILVHADPALLRILVQNLLDNAWKFTRRRERARIEFGTQVRDGERVYFVRDNGIGFDMAHAGMLFRPFSRLHSADDFPGHGVGLATIQRIVQRHGGRIWAEAATDQGATFFFTLGEPAESGA